MQSSPTSIYLTRGYRFIVPSFEIVRSTNEASSSHRTSPKIRWTNSHVNNMAKSLFVRAKLRFFRDYEILPLIMRYWGACEATLYI